MSISKKEKERKKMKKTMLQNDYIQAKKAIWQEESHHCAIGFDGKRYYAECALHGDFRYINEKNYDAVLNDMFYDYCLENASWMGVS